MCGLGGFVDRSGRTSPERREQIANLMAKQLVHRGPDETVIEHRANTTLVFTRLALTAPENGRQPFVSDDGMIQVIANGEVYNHKELEKSIPSLRMKTSSDCEVLLHLYEREGDNFLDRVRGMIACVVVDLRRGKILMGRDEFGIKPLFHTTDGPSLVFGSEIKTLLTHPEVKGLVDWDSALSSPALSARPVLGLAQPTSWFKGIELVPAGTIRTFDLTSEGWTDRTIRKPNFGFDGLTKRGDFVDLFDQTLTESVTACSTADVGLGIFLSGGVDSVLVAALAANSDMPTFSILTEGTIASGDALNAWESAQYLGLNHHQVCLSRRDVPSSEQWMNLVRTVESPQTGPEQYFKYSMHRLARELYPEVKGMLLGAAADEYYGGYSKMLADGGSWNEFLDLIAMMDSAGNDGWTVRGVSPVRARKRTPEELYNLYVAWKTSDVKQYNLWHEDRTAAAFGTEARVPYLDPKLVALINAVPAKDQENFLHDKSLLREVASRHLPERYAYREKVPFYHGLGFESVNIMFAKMLASNHYELIDYALQSETSREYIDAEAIRKLVDSTLEAPSNYRIDKILRLVNLGLLENLKPESVSYGIHERKIPHVTLEGTSEFSEAVPEELNDALSSELSNVVVKPRSGVIMARDEGSEGIFLIQDGEISFVIENKNEPIYQFLTAADGTNDLGKICNDLNLEPSEIINAAQSLLYAGFLQEVK